MRMVAFLVLVGLLSLGLACAQTDGTSSDNSGDESEDGGTDPGGDSNNGDDTGGDDTDDHGDANPTDDSDALDWVREDLTPCGDQTALFTVSPLEEDDFQSITPLGSLNPPDHTFPTVHTYMMLTDKTVSVPVTAPGDITITDIRSSVTQETGARSYSLYFYPCAEVSGYFNHMSDLIDELAALVEGSTSCNTYTLGSGTYTQCAEEVEVTVTAGTLVGGIGGVNSDGSAALDFGLRDARNDPAVYANMERFGGLDQLYTACPYDAYAAGAVSNLLLEKLQAESDIDPPCGTAAQDQAGTAQGRWFLVGEADNTESYHSALVPSNFDPADQVLSIGNADAGRGKYFFAYQSSGQINRNFAEVTNDSNTYCYENLRSQSYQQEADVSGHFIVKLTSDTTLSLERVSSGSCPADPNQLDFSSAAVLFER